MKFARFFVTSVSAIAISLTFGFMNKDRIIEVGNSELKAAAEVEAELQSRFGLVLDQSPAAPSDFSWMRFTLAERQAIKEKTFSYLAHMNRVMEIDSQKGIYITGKENLLAKMDFAQTVVKSAQIFEQRFGESRDLKKTAPPFKQAGAE